jgi:hypothetical protein
VIFVKSDPRLINFCLSFPDLSGIARAQLAFRASVRERASVPEAERSWFQVTQADPGRFRAPNLNRRNPHTVRLNTGDTYRGCLQVEVLRSGPWYKQIEGWCDALPGPADVTLKPVAAGGSQSPEQPPDRYCELRLPA